MGGFVIVSETRRWAPSNWVWRSVFERVPDSMVPDSDARQLVADALRGGLHWLDLREQPRTLVDEVALAVNAVVRSIEDETRGGWDARVPLEEYLDSLRDLQRLFIG